MSTLHFSLGEDIVRQKSHKHEHTGSSYSAQGDLRVHCKWVLTERRGDGESVALPRPTKAIARPFTYSCSTHPGLTGALKSP